MTTSDVSDTSPASGISAPSTASIGGRYIIKSPIGHGGMGAVYRAYDRLTGQELALKRVLAPSEQLIFNSLSETTNPRVALAHEFRALSSLRHPNIISVLDYGFDEELQPYFTMELLERAQTLVDACRNKSLEQQI